MVGLGQVAAVQAGFKHSNGKRTDSVDPPGPGSDRPDNEEDQAPDRPDETAAGEPQHAGDVPAQSAESGDGSTEKKESPIPGVDILFRYQDAAYEVYQHMRFQVFVAFLIGANFLTNVVQMQVDPGNDDNPIFNGLEWFYNIVFAMELIINMYGSWFFRFWSSNWNRFDFVVVLIGLLDQFDVPLPGPLTLLRMMRAFRVFRLFKKVKELNKIIVALQNAVPGVVNAFVIMMIVMAIYAILAVEFYQYVGEGCMDSEDEDDRTKFMSSRGGCVGEEYFGTFLSSLYTLFQVLTGDSWSEAIARPVMQSDDVNELVTGIFFVSFVLINAVVLINVVVAVVLDGMVTPAEEHGSAGAGSGGADGDRRESARQSSSEEQAVSLLSDVSKLRSDMLSVRDEVETVSADLNKGLERTQDDIASVQESLDVILAAVRQVAEARRGIV